MTQPRKHSALEAVANVVVGYGINFTANAIIFPRFGWDITVRQNLALGIFFTVVSVARSYTLRRVFNRASHRNKPPTRAPFVRGGSCSVTFPKDDNNGTRAVVLPPAWGGSKKVAP